MQDFSVMFHSVQEVEEFVGLVTTQPFRICLSDGVHKISGRGFVEMFCLDLTRPITVTAECDQEDFERFHQDAWQFLV